MKEKLEELKLKYRNAETDLEKEFIDIEIQRLFEEDGDKFAVTMVELARDTADKAEELVLRDKMESILPLVSVSYIAKTYFNRSRHWLYQRINGNVVNGKRAKLTKSEIGVLEDALQDISNKVGSVKLN